MPSKRALFIGLVAFSLIAAAWTESHADYDYVDINNPLMRKVPVAVPYFKRVSGAAEERRISREAAEILGQTLAFTGYFKFVDRGAYLADPENPNIVSPHIKFKNWTAVGAELLVTGGVMVTRAVPTSIAPMNSSFLSTFKNNLLRFRHFRCYMTQYS